MSGDIQQPTGLVVAAAPAQGLHLLGVGATGVVVVGMVTVEPVDVVSIGGRGGVLTPRCPAGAVGTGERGALAFGDEP